MSQTLAARGPATVTPLATETLDLSSPPTGKIVYVCQYSQRLRREQICLINADGSDLRVLTPAGAYDDFFPSLTPDGNAVLFASDRTGRYQIYEYDLLTETLTQLSHLDRLNAYAPTASPDGSLIVFYVISGGEYPSNHDIWLMERDGTNPFQLTNLSGGG